MKKIIALIMAEAAVILLLPVMANMFFLGSVSVSWKPIILLLRILFSGRNLLNALTMPNVLSTILYLALMIIVFIVQLILVYQALASSIKNLLHNRNTHSHGTARWATYKDLQKSRMIPANPKGICFAQTNDARAIEELGTNQKFRYSKLGSRLLSDDTAYHVLVIGGTGSYKGVSVAIPSLLTWKESVIFVDPKGESYEITAGYRSQFSNIFYFNPKDAKRSCHLNPLDFIPRTKDASSEIGKIVAMIHPDQSKDAYWDKVPRMMLEMLFGHVIINGTKKSIPEAADILFSGRSGKEIFDYIRKINGTKTERVNESTGEQETIWETKLATSAPLYEVQRMVLANANLFFDMGSGQDAQQLTTHITTVKTDMDVYIKGHEVMDSTDFKLDDICDASRPMSLYLCIPVSEIKNVMPMFKLIYTLILKHLLSGSQHHAHKLLLGLDEFSQFEKFEVIEEQLPFVRSYGIKIMAFIQSISQLDKYYTHDGRKAMMDNFQSKIFLKADENETLAYFEQKLGKETQVKKATSFSHNRDRIGTSSSTDSVSEIGRSLMTAEELGKMPLHECIVFSPEIPAYKACKIQYFTDPRFKNKINLPIPAHHTKSYYPTTLGAQEKADIHKYTSNIPAELITPELEKELQNERETAFRVAIEASIDELEQMSSRHIQTEPKKTDATDEPLNIEVVEKEKPETEEHYEEWEDDESTL